MFKFIVVVFFVPLLVKSVYCDQQLVRQTNNGPVEGIEELSSLGQKYYAFRGVPYAEPPITGIDPYTGEEVNRRFKVRYVCFSKHSHCMHQVT